VDVQYKVLEGDPGVVKTKGEEYQRIAAAISASVRTLDDIVEQVENKSLAMEATRSLAEDVASDIRKATARYQATGDALVTYAVELQTAQDASREPARLIAEAETELVEWRAKKRSRQIAYDTAVFLGDEDEIARTKERLQTAKDHVSAAEGTIAAQVELWEDARSKKDTAATAAVTSITTVTEGKGGEALNDSFWDKASVVLDVIKVICDIAAVLSIFLSWVPILGQILVVLAAIGAIISIIDAALKAISGEGSWGDFFGALALGVLSLFGGKIIGLLAKRIHFSAIRSLGTGVKIPTASRKLDVVMDLAPSNTKGALAFLKSPFVRSTSDMYRMLDFKTMPTKANFFKLLGEAAKQGNPFNVKTFMKFNGDVWDMAELTAQFGSKLDPSILNRALNVQVLDVLFHSYTNVKAMVDLGGNIQGGEPGQISIDVAQEILGRGDGSVVKGGKEGLDLYESVTDLLSNGTN
jgi:hypothetical protein